MQTVQGIIIIIHLFNNKRRSNQQELGQNGHAIF